MATRIRILVRRVHRWLGLSLGLVFAVLGLSGSALVFYTGIDAALHPAVRTQPSVRGLALSSPVWERTLATALAYRHRPGGKWTFEVTGEGGAIPARYYPEPGHHADREMVWFSPDGRRIIRAEPWGGYLMSWVYRLHMQLLAGEAGHRVVGWSGLAILALLGGGMAAWWPRGRWAKAIAFKRDAVPLRRLRDLHKLAGIWALAPLIVLVATGALLALPDVVQAILAPTKAPAIATAIGDGPRAPIARALGAARAALPDGRVVFFDVPVDRAQPIRVRMRVPGDPHARFPGSYVFVDQRSARVLAVQDVRRGNAGTTIDAWVRTLHDGTVGGLPTRILAVVVGLVPAFLFVTGFLHWRRRHGARGPRGDEPHAVMSMNDLVYQRSRVDRADMSDDRRRCRPSGPAVAPGRRRDPGAE